MGSFRRSLLLLAASLLIAMQAPGAEVSVLVDVSGTMGHYGRWQPDAVSLIQSILEGRSPATANFEVTGNQAAVTQFKVENGTLIELLRFGSIKSNEFPFFAQPQTVNDPADLAGVFPLNQPDYTQARTNKDLAEAVGAQLAASSPARLIVISDFLVDADMDQNEQEFVDRFQSANQIETPVIFKWRPDSRVMVKLILARPSTATAPVEAPQSSAAQAAPAVTISVRDAHALPNSDVLFFRWHAAGNTSGVQSYSVRLRHPHTHRVEKEIAGISPTASSARVKAPHGGKYLASVTAVLTDGSTVESGAVPVSTAKNNSGIVIAVILLIAITGVWLYMRRMKTRSHRRLTNEEESEKTA